MLDADLLGRFPHCIPLIFLDPHQLVHQTQAHGIKRHPSSAYACGYNYWILL